MKHPDKNGLAPRTGDFLGADRTRRAELDPAFGAAVVDLCHVVLNVNEFAYVD